MTETCMCPDVTTGVKTTTQLKYEKKMKKYNSNKEIKSAKELITQIKKYTNYVESGFINPFCLYVFKIIDKKDGKIYYKLGKANEPGNRIEEWIKDWSNRSYKNINDIESILVWSKECVYHKDNYTYYMTKNENLKGDDADYIFRDLLKEKFNTETYTLKNIYDKTITKECVDFKTTDDHKIVNILNSCFNYWIKLIEDPANENINVSGNFVRYIHGKKEDKQEFTDEKIRLEYQKKSAEWVYNTMKKINNDQCLLIVGCGGGKTSISLNGLVNISKDNNYNPILLLSGLNSVHEAFRDDINKYTYCGMNVELYTIEKFTTEKWKENKKNGIITLICTTCQSSVKSDDSKSDDNFINDKYVTKLSNMLKRLLDSGVRFSCGVTDEAHKIVFGEKMKTVFDLIRKYHTTNLNFLHMSGTGFNIKYKHNFENVYFVDDDEIRKEQGDAAVKRHIIVNRNDKFIPFFEKNIKNGWDILLDDKFDYKLNGKFKDIDSINCISTIRLGFVKPVIGAYLSSIEIVKKSFDYLNQKYTFDDVLIISANGCNSINNGFIRNGIGGNICKIKTQSDIKIEIRKAVAANKMVILLNVNKFVESWTIKEMNVQLILRNISSPDTFGQTICRSLRMHKHNEHVIKRDAFIFLYGNTFVQMAYEYNNGYHNIRKQNKKTNKIIGFMNAGDIFYMDGIKYTDGNLNDLDKIIKKYMNQQNIALDGFINNIIIKKFPNQIDEIIKSDNNIFKKITTRGGKININPVDTQNQNDPKDPANVDITNAQKDPANQDITTNQKTSHRNNENKNNNEKKQLSQLKTFIAFLQLEAITSYNNINNLKYDNLVNSIKENGPKYNEISEYYEYERMLSNCFGSYYDEFKNDIELWIENWIEKIN